MTPALYAEIRRAVNSTARFLSYEERQDLVQELAIRAVNEPLPHDKDERRWRLRRWAHERGQNVVRDADVKRTIDANSDWLPWKRKGANWSPSWYPPHEDAEQFAPFALEGARVIHCAGQIRDPFRAENTRLELLDNKKVFVKRVKSDSGKR